MNLRGRRRGEWTPRNTGLMAKLASKSASSGCWFAERRRHAAAGRFVSQMKRVASLPAQLP